jgi:hypothetical protein
MAPQRLIQALVLIVFHDDKTGAKLAGYDFANVLGFGGLTFRTTARGGVLVGDVTPKPVAALVPAQEKRRIDPHKISALRIPEI